MPSLDSGPLGSRLKLILSADGPWTHHLSDTSALHWHVAISKLAQDGCCTLFERDSRSAFYASGVLRKSGRVDVNRQQL